METNNTCTKILEMAYEENLSLLDHAQVWLHTFFCSACAQKIKLYHSARVMMHNDFFPPSPNAEESVMSKIAAENLQDEPVSANYSFSLRGWVITGIIIIVSFVTAFLGMDFQNVARETGTSFMLPVGILFGIVLTIYCAFFIGSHLKELSRRFGL